MKALKNQLSKIWLPNFFCKMKIWKQILFSIFIEIHS